MNTRGFSAIAPSGDGAEAARFIEAWHGPGNDDQLMQITRMNGPVQHQRPLTFPKGTITEMLREADLDELVYSDEKNWNLYHSVGFMNAAPPAGRRGGKAYIAAVPGVWLDLDANKDRAFLDQDEILDFLETLGVQPSIMVATGTGGVHAYWRTPDLLEPSDAERLGQMWWSYAQAAAGSIVIDRVFNCDRVLRLPGSVRWPKKTEAPSVSQILAIDEGRTVTAADLESVSRGAWEAVVEVRRRTRQDVSRSQVTALDLAGENPWQRMWIASQLPDLFNETHTWEQVLEPYGWRRLGQDYEGRVQWARPNGDGSKSATTDWVESPHVMSLFSTSPDTGLLGLKDADIPLTKYRVHVQLAWEGDETTFVREYMRTLQENE